MDSRSPTAFCTDLKRRLVECQKFAVPLTLVLLDIDDFKPLVDNLGDIGTRIGRDHPVRIPHHVAA